MFENISLIATSAFGLEAVVARELRQLGYEPQIKGTGQIQRIVIARRLLGYEGERHE